MKIIHKLIEQASEFRLFRALCDTRSFKQHLDPLNCPQGDGALLPRAKE